MKNNMEKSLKIYICSGSPFARTHLLTSHEAFKKFSIFTIHQKKKPYEKKTASQQRFVHRMIKQMGQKCSSSCQKLIHFIYPNLMCFL